jgi:hypothetical protein
MESIVLDGWGCGQNWGEIEVRQPYKGIDVYVEILPRLPGAIREDLVADLGHYERARIAREWVEDGMVDGAIEHAEDMLDRYNMDASNREAIQAYIKKALVYFENAQALWNYWSRRFVPGKTPADPMKAPNMVHVAGSPHWMLTSRAYPGCTEEMSWPDLGLIPVTQLDGNYGGGRDFLDVACPHKHEILAHHSDANVYYDLVVAAIMNARCASEAAAAVGLFYKNRSRISGKIKTPTKSKTNLGSAINIYAPGGVKQGPGAYAPLQPGEPQPPIIGAPAPEPGPEEPQIPEGDTKAARAKKKDNTILIAAAAGAALLIFGRK